MSSERLWQASMIVRTAYASYFADTPPYLLVTTTLPRAVLQCLFFTLLGRVVGGDAGAEFAFVGSVALILTLSTMVGVCDVPTLEKWSGTFYRLQLGRPGPAAVCFLRALPWVTEAFVAAILSIVVVGLATGQAEIAMVLLSAAPLYLLIAVTSIAAGLAAASLTLSSYTDILVGNTMAYLTIAASGVLIPTGRLPWLDRLGSILPVQHGVLAIRAFTEGRPWLGAAAAELGVGIAWAAVGWFAYGAVAAKARRAGFANLT